MNDKKPPEQSVSARICVKAEHAEDAAAAFTRATFHALQTSAKCDIV